MNAQMLNSMMNMLKMRNPQGFARINQAMQLGSDPQDLIKQFMSKATTEQKESVLQQARQMGVPDNILKQVQNMK